MLSSPNKRFNIRPYCWARIKVRRHVQPGNAASVATKKPAFTTASYRAKDAKDSSKEQFQIDESIDVSTETEAAKCRGKIETDASSVDLKSVYTLEWTERVIYNPSLGLP